MIRLAVVEDDAGQAQQIRDYLDRYARERNCLFKTTYFQDGEDISEDYRADYDVILMDIQMAFMDGMTAAQIIRRSDPKVVIVFITNLTGYAIKGYEVDALDYIVKPLTGEVFSNKLARAIDRVRTEETHYVNIPVRGGMRRANLNDLLYIESRGHNMEYHMPGEVLSASGKLDELEISLAPQGFYRISRCYLVNLRHVDGIRDGGCLIRGQVLPISRKKTADFMHELSKLL